MPDAFSRHMRARDKTLRDWFAGQALIGLMAGRKQGANFTVEEAAAHSFAIADAMLERRLNP